MHLAIRCRCGKLKGEVDARGVSARATCYCKDCQAYARFLRTPADFLDPAGGTDVAVTLPAAVRFTEGIEHLACMALGDKGIYRWYAACCRTPIGNTPRSAKIAFVGLVRVALAVPDDVLGARLGAARTVLHTESARGSIASTPARVAWASVRIGAIIWRARLTGSYKTNPFFDAASRRPVRMPQVLTPAERAALG